MSKPVSSSSSIKKINSWLFASLAVVTVGLSGCSTPATKAPATETSVKTSDAKVQQKDSAKQTQVSVNKQPVRVAQQKSKGKDRHQIEYEQKRLRYHQEWERQQAAREAQQRLASQRARQQQNWQTAQRAYVDNSEQLSQQLSYAAIDRTHHRVIYDGRYIPIAYPMGDVPSNIGVCSDTVIRSYRRLGVDLQRLVHEDISRAFYSYPNLAKWGLQGPDPNIDHRRVLNLKVFFSRNGQRLPVSGNPYDYRPGDLVTWDLGGGQEHIGIVVNQRSEADPRRYMIVHNIGAGDKMEDVLFKMPISGHYRYFPRAYPQAQLASLQRY